MRAANYSAVPAELRALCQWVVWRRETRPGEEKPTKVPYIATAPERRASSTDPATWATFEEAAAAAAEHGFDGIGVVVTKDDPYVGVDLDGVRDPDTGELSPDALTVVALLESYTEVSPSGRGLRVFLRGRKPPGSWSKRNGIEVYDSGRFLTVTGERIAMAPAEVGERQKVLELFIGMYAPPPAEPVAAAPVEPVGVEDAELLEMARRARNGEKFSTLYDRGDWGLAAYGSQSEADLALCTMLAFWTGRDAARVDRLFRASALMRPKWDRSVGQGETYGQRTVRMAAEATHEVYTPASPDRNTRGDRSDRSDQTPPVGTLRSLSSLRSRVDWPAPMAAAAFHGLAGEFVETVAEHTEADPAALLVGFLVQVGREIGRTAYVQVGATRHHPNLYAVVVGPSGAAGRKGTAYSESERVVELAVPNAGLARTHKGAASGEGIIWAVRDAITKVGKDGAEELVDPGIADKRLLLREGEFSAVLRVAARDSNTLSTVLRDAWDGSNLQTLAKNSPARATRPHICLLADITPDELRRELTATDKANGFGNRILWCCSRRSRLLPDGGEPDPVCLQALADRLAAALAQVEVMGRVERDPAARELWHEVYPELTRERPGLLGALLARAEAQVVRLSLIYAVLGGYHTVRREHLEAALAVWRYCEDSAAHIFGGRLGDPLADELLSALRRTPGGLTRTEIRDLLGRHRGGEEIDRALAVLEEHRLAWREQEDTGGRPRERWHATEATEATEAGQL